MSKNPWSISNESTTPEPEKKIHGIANPPGEGEYAVIVGCRACLEDGRNYMNIVIGIVAQTSIRGGCRECNRQVFRVDLTPEQIEALGGGVCDLCEEGSSIEECIRKHGADFDIDGEPLWKNRKPTD